MSKGKKTKLRILNAGLKLWPDVTLQSIATASSCTHQAVLYHFGTVENLKNKIAEHAVDLNDSKVIVQLMIVEHEAVRYLTPRDRAYHLNRV